MTVKCKNRKDARWNFASTATLNNNEERNAVIIMPKQFFDMFLGSSQPFRVDDLTFLAIFQNINEGTVGERRRKLN